MKRALVEAAEGKIGSSINRFTYITGCFLYDESSGKYTPQAMGIHENRWRGNGDWLVVCTLVPYWFLGAGRKSAVQNKSDNDLDSVVEVAT